MEVPSALLPDSDVEIVEVYVPRRLEYLSELYRWLKDEMGQRDSEALFRGFSIYEVAGAYQGAKQLYTEQTLVIRLLFDSSEERAGGRALAVRMQNILAEIVRITNEQEEEIWITRTAAKRTSWSRPAGSVA